MEDVGTDIHLSQSHYMKTADVQTDVRPDALMCLTPTTKLC